MPDIADVEIGMKCLGELKFAFVNIFDAEFDGQQFPDRENDLGVEAKAEQIRRRIIFAQCHPNPCFVGRERLNGAQMPK